MPQPPIRRRPPRRARRVGVGLVVVVAVAVSLAGVGMESGGARAAAVARYPGQAAEEVSGSAKIYVQLQVGWFAPHKNFDIVVTGPAGHVVDGRSVLDEDEVLSFTPDNPMGAGKHEVQVHHRESPQAEGNIFDSWSITVASAPGLSGGSGGSILLIARQGTRDSYIAEILRAEGMNDFSTLPPEAVTSDVLADHTVVVLGAMSSTGDHIPAVESWVSGGGELIAMTPEGGLAAMAGLVPTGEKLEDAYLEIDTTQAPGVGLTSARMQVSGGAVLYSGSPESRSVATLWSGTGDVGPYPAVTLTEVGDNRGHIAAFAFDLPTSVMYTRQGHPEQAGQERDGFAPIRPNDFFTGADGKAGSLDLSKIGIPQADEQMRLLSNLLVELHAHTSPLPRFWYLPNSAKAAIVMTADDHGTEDGTSNSFERMLALAEPGCDVDQWECPRATSWLYPSSSLTEREAEYYSGMGFDIGAHVSTDCENWTRASLHTAFASSMLKFRSKYSSLPDQTGHRLHCIAYSDWLGLPTEEHRWGIRLDMNYYNWPAHWIRGKPGYLTGSALPMRFGDESGRMLDVFQQESHLVNETWKGSTRAIEELITAAEDERGYYGAFGTHYDFSDDFDEDLMTIANRRDVPMISAQQLLDFTDGRQASGFDNLAQTSAGSMTFDVDVDVRVDGLLCAILPMNSGDKVLTSITAGGETIDYDVESIKGISYAMFEVDNLGYEAAYR